jgi:hypothetical protein
MKTMLLLTILSCPLFVYAAEPVVSVSSRCFVSQNNKIKIRMFWVSSEDWASGYIQYGEKKTKIPIVQVKRTEEYLVEGRPPAVESEWVEIVDGHTSGKYMLQYQGAVADAAYINKNGKRFVFAQENNDYEDCFKVKNNNEN